LDVLPRSGNEFRRAVFRQTHRSDNVPIGKCCHLAKVLFGVVRLPFSLIQAGQFLAVLP
jgi:hypothetical protein